MVDESFTTDQPPAPSDVGANCSHRNPFSSNAPMTMDDSPDYSDLKSGSGPGGLPPLPFGNEGRKSLVLNPKRSGPWLDRIFHHHLNPRHL